MHGPLVDPGLNEPLLSYKHETQYTLTLTHYPVFCSIDSGWIKRNGASTNHTSMERSATKPGRMKGALGFLKSFPKVAREREQQRYQTQNMPRYARLMWQVNYIRASMWSQTPPRQSEGHFSEGVFTFDTINTWQVQQAMVWMKKTVSDVAA